MTTLTEGQHPLQFLISEADGYGSREVWTFGADLSLVTGTIVMIADPQGVESPPGVATGTAYATASFVDGQSKVGILGYPVETGSGESMTAVVVTNRATYTLGEVTIPGGQSITTIQPRLETMHVFGRPYGLRTA